MRKKIDSFQGIKVLITGASSGIGAQLAIALGKEGAEVALVARNAPRLRKVADQILKVNHNAKVHVFVCDVRCRELVEDTFHKAMKVMGSIEILINNAGYGHHELFSSLCMDKAEDIMQTNFWGSIYWAKAVISTMIAQKKGWIVFISSICGRFGVPDESIYVATKFALTGFAETLSMEVEKHGIQIMTVYPAAVDTPFFSEDAKKRLPPATLKNMIKTEKVVQEILKGLRKGHRELAVPRTFKFIFLVKAILPDFFRKQTQKTVMSHISGL